MNGLLVYCSVLPNKKAKKKINFSLYACIKMSKNLPKIRCYSTG